MQEITEKMINFQENNTNFSSINFTQKSRKSTLIKQGRIYAYIYQPLFFKLITF